MKKILTILLCLAFIVLLPIGAFATESDQPVLSADLEQAIKDAYRLRYDEPGILDEDLFLEYHGVFNGVHVTFVDCSWYDYMDSETIERVGPYLFFYGSSRTLHAYREGKLLSLPEAWTAGWFTTDTVRQLYSYYTQAICTTDFSNGVNWNETDWAQFDMQFPLEHDLLYIDLFNWLHSEASVQHVIAASKANWDGYFAVQYRHVLGFRFVEDPIAMPSAMAQADETSQTHIASCIASSEAYVTSNVDIIKFLTELQLPADAAAERAMLNKIIGSVEQYYGVEIPRTGDYTAVVLMALLLSGAGLAILTCRRKKNIA